MSNLEMPVVIHLRRARGRRYAHTADDCTRGVVGVQLFILRRFGVCTFYNYLLYCKKNTRILGVDLRCIYNSTIKKYLV